MQLLHRNARELIYLLGALKWKLGDRNSAWSTFDTFNYPRPGCFFSSAESRQQQTRPKVMKKHRHISHTFNQRNYRDYYNQNEKEPLLQWHRNKMEKKQTKTRGTNSLFAWQPYRTQRRLFFSIRGIHVSATEIMVWAVHISFSYFCFLPRFSFLPPLSFGLNAQR